MNIETSPREVSINASNSTASGSWWVRNGEKIIAQQRIRQALKVAGWVVFALYVTGLVTMLTRRASTFPVALAESSDAANAMNVLSRTSWHSDNGFSYYGPLYYRLARSFMYIDPVYRVASVTNVDIRDKAAHIALMLTSLVALILLAVVLANLVGPDWSLGWISGLFMFAFFSNSELWMDFAVDNHPDLVLSMFIALATAATVKSIRSLLNGETRFLWMVGAAWGLALLTKVTASTFFVTALVVIAAAAWRGRCLRRAGLTVVASSLITYMVVGFPQSLDVLRVLKSMRYVASVTVNTFDWIFWRDLLEDTAVLPLLVVVGVILLSVRSQANDKGRMDPPGAFLGLSFIIPGFAFFSLFWLSYQNHMRHYILPVVAALVVTVVPVIRRGAVNGYRRLPAHLKPWLQITGAVILLGVIVKGRRQYHNQTTSRVVARFQLQDEAREVQKVVRDDLEAGKNVVADPFVPIDVRTYSITSPSLGFTKDILGQFLDAEIFVSSRWYHERFLRASAEPWTLLNLSETDYRQRHDFYSLLDKDSFVDGMGRTWKLRLRTPLGWAVWDNAGDSTPLTVSGINAMVAARSRILPDVLLNLDVSKLASRDGVLYVSSKSGQEIRVEGPTKIVPAPRPNQNAFTIQSTPPFTRASLDPSFIGVGKGTFAAWAQITNPKKASSILLSVNTVLGAPRAIYLEHYATGRFSALFNGQRMTVSDVVVSNNHWHHYVLTWDDGAQRFYIDGHLIGSSAVKLLTTGCRTFSLGWLGENNDESQWPGSLAEVVTLKRPLSSEEVTALYRVGMNGKPILPKS